MSDVTVPDDASAELECEPDVVFGAADDLRRATQVSVDEGLPLPMVGHPGANDVFGLINELLTQLQSNIGAAGATLANAAQLTAVETMIADWSWTHGDGRDWSWTESQPGRRSWYGL